MSNVNIPAHSVKSIVTIGVKALRSAFKLLSKVAGPAVMDSPQSRTFLRADETSTWFGASHAHVTLMTRVDSRFGWGTQVTNPTHDVPFARFKRITELVTCDTIGVELSEDNNVLGISALDQKGGLSSTFKLASTPEASAPEIPTMEPFPYSEAWGVDSLEMVRAIDQCIPSMGKPGRFDVDGIFIECGDDSVTLLATDRAKITRARMDASTEGYRPAKPMQIPRSGLKALSAFLASLDGSTARFAFEQGVERQYQECHYLRFRSDSLDLRIRLDNYASLPKFSEEEVFSAPPVASITIHDVKAFTKAVKAASHDGSVELSYDQERVLVSSGDGAETEVFPGRGNHSGEAFARSLNAKALLAYLKTQAKSDRLAFGIAGHAERKAMSDGKTWDKFGPVKIVAENGAEFVMQPIDVEVIGAAPMVVEPEPVAEDVPEPACDVEAVPAVETIVPTVEPVREPVKPLPAWVDHVKVKGYDRITDYRRNPGGKAWHPSGHGGARYMAIEKQAEIEAMYARGEATIITPEPSTVFETPTTLDGIIAQSIDAYRDALEPGRGYLGYDACEAILESAGPVARSQLSTRLFVLGFRPKYPARTPLDQLVGFIGQCVHGSEVSFPEPVEASPEPVMERTIVRSAACSPEPTDPEPVKPLTPVPSFSGSPSAQRANAVYTPIPAEPPVPEFSGPVEAGIPSHVNRVEALNQWTGDRTGETYRRYHGAWSHERLLVETSAKTMDRLYGAGMLVALPDLEPTDPPTDYGHKGLGDDSRAVDAAPVPDWLKAPATPVPGFSELAPICGGSPEAEPMTETYRQVARRHGKAMLNGHAWEVEMVFHGREVVLRRAIRVAPHWKGSRYVGSGLRYISIRRPADEIANPELAPICGGSPDLDIPPVPVFPDEDYDNGDRPDDDHDTPSSWDGIPEPFDPDATMDDIPITPEDHEADEWALYDACESMIIAGSRRSRLAHVEDAIRTIILHILETEVRIGQAARVTWNHRMSAERREDFLEWIGSNGILVDPNGDAPTDPAEMFEWLCVECRDGSTVDFPEPTPTPDPDGDDDDSVASLDEARLPVPAGLPRGHDPEDHRTEESGPDRDGGRPLPAPGGPGDHGALPRLEAPAPAAGTVEAPDTLTCSSETSSNPEPDGGDDGDEAIGPGGRRECGRWQYPQAPIDLGRHHDAAHDQATRAMERGAEGAGLGAPDHDRQRPPTPDTLTIDGRAYGVSWRLGYLLMEKNERTTYEVTTDPLGRPWCSCPDAIHRRNGLDSRGCRHYRAALAAGLLPQAQPAPPLPGPVPEFFRNPCPAYIDMSAL